MTVYLGADHAGYQLKEKVKKVLDTSGVEYEDLSPDFKEGDDYPDDALRVSERVVKEDARGILFCGSGIGMTLAANKVPGIRAGACRDKEAARLSRAHTDTNILVLSGWFEKLSDLKGIVTEWLNTEFEGGRHKRRLDKITGIEEKYSRQTK